MLPYTTYNNNAPIQIKLNNLTKLQRACQTNIISNEWQGNYHQYWRIGKPKRDMVNKLYTMQDYGSDKVQIWRLQNDESIVIPQYRWEKSSN